MTYDEGTMQFLLTVIHLNIRRKQEGNFAVVQTSVKSPEIASHTGTLVTTGRREQLSVGQKAPLLLLHVYS